MRLRWWQRLALVFVGVGLLGAGGVGAAFDWSGVALTAFIVAGVFVLLGAVVGAMPKGSFKEGNVEWPDVDKHPRIEHVEAEIGALRTDLTKTQNEAQRLANYITDYVHAQEPDPGDGKTNEERVEELRRTVADLSGEISMRNFTGETYDDGLDVTEMEQWRDESRKDLEREERRQAARKRFGISVEQ